MSKKPYTMQAISKTVLKEDSDISQLLRWRMAPQEDKPEISARLLKKHTILSHAIKLINEHKVPDRVVPMLKTLYGIKSDAYCYEIVRDAKLVQSAESQVSKSVEKKFIYDWLIEKAKKADEKGDEHHFIKFIDMAQDLMGLSGEDPDFDMLAKAEAHNIFLTADPDAAGFKPIPADRKEKLRNKYLEYASKAAETANTARAPE